MQELLECAEDICIDVPMFWEYMAEIFSPMLESGAMKWTSLKDYAHKIEKPGHVEKFLSSVIIVASKEMVCDAFDIARLLVQFR